MRCIIVVCQLAKIRKNNSWRRERERVNFFDFHQWNESWARNLQRGAYISSPMVKLCVHPRLATSCAIIKLPVWSWQPQGQKTKRQGKRRKLLFLCRTARVQSGIHEPDATCLIYTRAIRTPRHSHTCVYLRCTLNCDLIDDIIFQFEK